MLQIEDEQNSYKNIVKPPDILPDFRVCLLKCNHIFIVHHCFFWSEGKREQLYGILLPPWISGHHPSKAFKTFTGLKSSLRQSSVLLWIKHPSAFCPLPVSPALRLFSSQWCSKLHLPASFPGRCWILEIYRPWGTPLGEENSVEYQLGIPCAIKKIQVTE